MLEKLPVSSSSSNNISLSQCSLGLKDKNLVDHDETPVAINSFGFKKDSSKRDPSLIAGDLGRRARDFFWCFSHPRSTYQSSFPSRIRTLIFDLVD